jgi:hypothetical protein
VWNLSVSTPVGVRVKLKFLKEVKYAGWVMSISVLLSHLMVASVDGLKERPWVSARSMPAAHQFS